MKQVGKIISLLLVFSMLCALLGGCAEKTDDVFSAESLNCLIDLHLHLDGAISVESARQLAQMQNITIPESDAELEKLLRVSDDCKDLNEFLEKFALPCSLIQTADSIQLAVCNLLSELQAEGLIYAEIRFAPQKSTEQGLTQEQAIEAAIKGVQLSDLPVNLILCCMRGDDTHDANIETLLLAEKYLNHGVCALDLAGAEALYPNEDYEDIFALAKEKNIPFTIHAGEAAGAESVSKALDFGADRIGHGVRAAEDKAVMQRLAESDVTLELCPTSNLKTAIYDSISDYPYKTLIDAGVSITINTDDKSIEGITLREEYQLLIDEFKLSRQDVHALLLNSADKSFADEELKAALKDKIDSEMT